MCCNDKTKPFKKSRHIHRQDVGAPAPPLSTSSLDLLKVEHVAVEVREDVPLEEMLLTVEGELLGADGTHLPVALHVPLEAALLKVRREDHLAQRAALVNVAPGGRKQIAD